VIARLFTLKVVKTYVSDDGVNIRVVGQNCGQEEVDVLDTGSWVTVVAVGPSTLTTWVRPARKSTIQLQRELFNPRILSLVKSLEETMV
jgi:hypothetical protein